MAVSRVTAGRRGGRGRRGRQSVGGGSRCERARAHAAPATISRTAPACVGAAADPAVRGLSGAGRGSGPAAPLASLTRRRGALRGHALHCSGEWGWLGATGRQAGAVRSARGAGGAGGCKDSLGATEQRARALGAAMACCGLSPQHGTGASSRACGRTLPLLSSRCSHGSEPRARERSARNPQRAPACCQRSTAAMTMPPSAQSGPGPRPPTSLRRALTRLSSAATELQCKFGKSQCRKQATDCQSGRVARAACGRRRPLSWPRDSQEGVAQVVAWAGRGGGHRWATDLLGWWWGVGRLRRGRRRVMGGGRPARQRCSKAAAGARRRQQRQRALARAAGSGTTQGRPGERQRWRARRAGGSAAGTTVLTGSAAGAVALRASASASGAAAPPAPPAPPPNLLPMPVHCAVARNGLM